MIVFNHRGLLIPETIIPSTLSEFEVEFAVKLSDGKRKELFDQFKLYCNDLKAVCGNKPIVQWIDGSYVTKSKNPSDIDLVFFLDYETAREKENELKQFIYPQSIAKYGIDGYIVVVYPDKSKHEYISTADRAYWVNQFGNTKPTRSHKKIPKGFLEIII